MSTVVWFVVPIDEVVHVGDSDERKIVIERDLECLLRIGAAIGYFYAMQEAVFRVVCMEVVNSGNAIGLLTCPPRVIPEQEPLLSICGFNYQLRGPLASGRVVCADVARIGGHVMDLKELVRIVEEHCIDMAGRSVSRNFTATDNNQL